MGKTWLDINDGTLPANISYLSGDLRSSGIVYIATGGRGIIYGKDNTVSASNLEIENHATKVYPNPATNQLTVEFQKRISYESAILTLSDISGRNVCNRTISNMATVQLDVSKIAKGLYFLNILQGTENQTTKVIIQ